jgi:hypothetical protein
LPESLTARSAAAIIAGITVAASDADDVGPRLDEVNDRLARIEAALGQGRGPTEVS